MAEKQLPTGTTARLIVKPLALEDAAQIQRIFAQWEIVRHLLNRVPWPYPEDGAESYLRELALPAMERGEELHWTLRLKTKPEEIIGMISLKLNDEDHRGFWLGADWQGQGLMSEAAAWVTDYWFDVLGFKLLHVSKSRKNERSRRISERQGMRLVGHAMKEYVSGPADSEIWELTAEEWRKSRDKRTRD